MKSETYCCDETTEEVWRAYREKVIADIRAEHKVNRELAEYMLHNATIDNPVKISPTIVAWIEDANSE